MADPEFLLLGDALWLDFVNTAALPGRDLLPDAAALLRWTKAVKVAPVAGPADFETALDLRTRLAALAAALEAGRSAPPSAIEAINGFLAGREGREQLVRIGGRWRIRFAPHRAATAFEAIAGSAARTLAHPVAVVRRCAAPDCGLFFVDESPTQSRRWCSRRCGQRGRVERRRVSPRLTPLVTEG
ncbi:MAG TPA: CGNR zinc finger domain-containing protein [Gemmatimonadales bacterium]|jgi:predicted RNA-binding Zn ribbon-like protein|nr:CGNR zinc finger domain-containing protein [Gemmatimonadales bacterium]